MPPARMLVIVNPAARHGQTAALIPVIEQLLEAMVDHDTVITESPGHSIELAASSQAYSVVVAVGGDGTAHEVLNGLMRIPQDRRPALGLLPTGSGNDTRRTLGISKSLSDAVLELAADRRQRFDVGVCNGVYFNNSFAAGLDAKVTAKAVEYKVTKERDGLWLYLTALFYVLMKDLDSFDVRVSFDEEAPSSCEALLIACTQGPTYGGGFFITPDADPHDGLFDVCLIDPLSLPQAIVRLPFVIAGKHTSMKVVHMSKHSRVVIECDEPLPAQIDGEVLLERRYELSSLPAAIECVVPERG